MRYARLTLILAALAWLCPGLGAAEAMATLVQQTQHPVAGQVTHSNGPLAGVLVTVKGTAVRTLTNPSGRYQIAATSPQDTLVFTLLGWEERELGIGGRRG